MNTGRHLVSFLGSINGSQYAEKIFFHSAVLQDHPSGNRENYAKKSQKIMNSSKHTHILQTNFVKSLQKSSQKTAPILAMLHVALLKNPLNKQNSLDHIMASLFQVLIIPE